MEIKCDLCHLVVKRRTDLARHKKSDNCKKINNILNTIILENDKYKNEIQLLKQESLDKDKQIKLLQEKSEEYRKIVEKAATKTTIKNNNNNYTNNYLNYISSEPLKFKEIKEQAKKYINSVSVMYDDDDFHDHIVDNILKDKSGKDKVLCTDINRKNFTYKDEVSGKMIYDPELERLREQLKKGTDIRQIRAELLEKLVSEYEQNGGVDPFKQFSEIIQKLNFGNPFVDHIAKKTYVKRCASNDSPVCATSLETKNTDLELIDNNFKNEFNEEEEEYQKLLAEFGNEIN